MAAKDTIGRAFVEIGANIQPLVKDIDGAVKTMSEADAKLTSYGNRIGKSFENALNPTVRLEKQLSALGATGKSSGDLVKVYGDRILKATAIAEQHGQALSPVMQNYRQLALATQTSTVSSVAMATQLGRTSEQMREANMAAALLGRQIGIQLPQSVRRFIAESSLIGPILSSAFKVTVWAAIGLAIYEAGKRLWEWAQGSKEAAENTQKLTDEVEKATAAFDTFYDRMDAARRAGATVGMGGTAKLGVEVGFKQEDVQKARLAYEALAEQYNRLYFKSRRGAEFGEDPAVAQKRRIDAMNEMVAVQEKMIAAEQEYKVLQIELANLQKQHAISAIEDARKLGEERYKALRAALEEQHRLGTAEEQWIKLIDGAADSWRKNVLPGMIAAREEQEKLNAETERLQRILESMRPRGGALTPDESGRLEPDLTPSDVLGKMKGQTGQSPWMQQVSTIFTDFSAALARAAMDAKNFGSILVAAAKSTGEMLLRLLMEQVLGNVFKRLAGAGGGGGGWGQSFAGAAGGLSGLFKGGQQGGANLQASIGSGGSGGFWNSAGGGALLAGGMVVGTALLSNAWQTGSKLKGTAGGALAGASVGMQVGGPIGAAIGASVGAAAGFIVGMFGGGEMRRQMERERRANIQAGYMSDAMAGITRSGAFGFSGEMAIEADLMGRSRVRPVVIQIQALDVEDFERRTGYLSHAVSTALMRGGNQLSDNIAYAAR